MVDLDIETVTGSQAKADAASLASQPRKVTTTVQPFLAAVSPGSGGGFRRVMLGYDATDDRAFFTNETASTLYQSSDGEVTWTDKGLPTGAAITAVTGAAGQTVRCQVVRHGSYLYATFKDTLDSNKTKVYRTFPAPGATAFSWSAAVLTLQSGGTGYPTAMSSDGTYLMLGEYNDPLNGSSVKAATIYRTADGVTWTPVYVAPSTTRHIHAVEADPYNAGHWWATLGDAGGTIIIRSVDSGATWTVISTVTGHQSVQISFSPKRVWLASDQDGVSVYTINRTAETGRPALTVCSVTTNYHSMLGVPGGAAADQFFSKGWFGCCDPTQESFYLASVSSTTGGNRAGLFYLPFEGGALNCVDVVPTGGTDFGFGRVFLYRGGVRYGTRFFKKNASYVAVGGDA
jgi:hypothetical protein